jgi:pilus assembly protein TadC
MRADKLPWRRMLSSFVVYVLFYFLFRAVTNWHLFASRGFWPEFSDLMTSAFVSGVFFVVAWQALAALQRSRRNRPFGA